MKQQVLLNQDPSMSAAQLYDERMKQFWRQRIIILEGQVIHYRQQGRDVMAQLSEISARKYKEILMIQDYLIEIDEQAKIG